MFVVRCGTNYDHLDQLDKHIVMAHMNKEGGLLTFPRALPAGRASAPRTPTSPINIPTGTMNQPGAGEKNKAPLTITAFMKDESRVKALKTDSAIQVTRKLSTLMEELEGRFSIFTSDGMIKTSRWSNMVRVIEIFLMCDSNAFPTLQVVARAATGARDLFMPNTTTIVSCQDLKQWVQKTWARVAEITPMQKMAKLVSEARKAPSSTSTADLYKESLAQVETLLEGKFEVIMTTTSVEGSQKIEAWVDLTPIIVKLVTLAKFRDSYDGLWLLVKKINLQSALFPRSTADVIPGKDVEIKALQEFDRARAREAFDTPNAANNQDEEDDGEENTETS